MAKIFITGSADGLGQLSAKALADEGHEVFLHARNAERGAEAKRKVPGAQAVLIGDLSDVEQTKKLAAAANELGRFDAVIHNAGVYQVSAKTIFAVNTLAPYILTCLMDKPKRLIYLSSSMHLQGHFHEDQFTKDSNRISYSDSKLHVLMLSMAVARKWPEVFSNALDPGWVPTKMGGQGAPDDLHKGYETQVWLTTSNDPKAHVTGRYFYHQKERRYNPQADDISAQERLLKLCGQITGIEMPV
jgi:NAD(P)-dependent dehydrogenase (short-subunit alcohol dehydrogenase family)